MPINNPSSGGDPLRHRINQALDHLTEYSKNTFNNLEWCDGVKFSIEVIREYINAEGGTKC